MLTADFDYHLPPELIASEPLLNRAASRMMVVHRDSGRIEHRQFADLPSFARAGDLFVFNDTRVVPARFFSPDGKRVALVTRTALVLWDIASETIVWEVPNTFIQQIAYSHDGTLIATCGNDRLVRVVDSRDGTIRFQSTNHRAPVRCVVFSADGRLLATAAGDGTIKLWHVASGQELVELPNAVDDIPHIEFSDDGNQLICQMRRHGSTDVSDRIVIFDGSRFDP